MRNLVPTTTRPGSIFFDLLNDAGEKLATVLASPFDAKVVISNTSTKQYLTADEKLFCQLEAKKSL